MKKISELTKREKAYGLRIGLFLHVYNTINFHKEAMNIFTQEKKDTIQYGLFASDLYLLFVLMREHNYLKPIEKDLESAFSINFTDSNCEIIESECVNLDESDKIITFRTFRNAIAHGGFYIPEYGADYYKFVNNNSYDRKKIVFKMPFVNIQYLVSQVMSFIEWTLINEGVISNEK